MENYEKLIMDLIKGDTPKQKYENIKAILEDLPDMYLVLEATKNYLTELEEAKIILKLKK